METTPSFEWLNCANWEGVSILIKFCFQKKTDMILQAKEAIRRQAALQQSEETKMKTEHKVHETGDNVS